MPASSRVDVLAERALALDLVDRHAAVDRRAHGRMVVGDREGDVAAKHRRATSDRRRVRMNSPFRARLTTIRTSRSSISWRAHQLELAPRAVQAGNAQLRDQQDEVRPRQQRQRPVGPVGRQVDEHRAELARRDLDDRSSSWSLVSDSSGIIVARRGDDLQAAADAAWSPTAAGRRRAASRPRSGRQGSSVGRRPSWKAASPNWTSRSIRQASRPKRASCRAKRMPSCDSSAVAPTPPSLLMTLTTLACCGLLPLPRAGRDSPRIGVKRGLELDHVERQAARLVRAGADQRADEGKRRVIGGGDQRRLG